MLDDYESGDDMEPKADGANILLSAITQDLLHKLKGAQPSHDDQVLLDETKIIFCSRTHSQLTQFVGELRQVKPPSSVGSDMNAPSSGQEIEELVKHLSLGSRKNLCINPRVSRLKTTSEINERCLELQKPGTSKATRCSLMPSKDNRGLVERFRDNVLAQVQDIEDIASLGRDLGICPYYASRSAILQSEILTLPYPLLLQKSARDALGMSVKGHVVVIDEAHNLMDAISNTYSIAVTLTQLDRAISQITVYAQRFKTRLKGKNRVYITQILRLLNSIADGLRQTASGAQQHEVVASAAQLMAGKGVDQIRPHKLLRYLQESKLAYKVGSYVDSQKESNKVSEPGALTNLQNFLVILLNPSEEGRLFVWRQDQDISVRYTLLDPREHFRDIVEEARAVILAGGTMSPMSDYTEYLFSYLPSERLKTYSFGHVIPSRNLFARAITAGPAGLEFEFTFESRRSEPMIIELGTTILGICRTVPDGIVVFFPSYEYLSQVLNAWKRPMAGASILASMEKTKMIFEESKSGGKTTEELLREYAQAVDSGKGALLLSVVGGKLSEGINFSNELGRAVVAIGLPFPNMHSAEWKAKIEYVEKTCYKRLSEKVTLSEHDRRTSAKAAGREFYENACMRAVNQCIGRAIRHRNDYAAILLVDKRYSTLRIQKKLPQWIQESMDTSAIGKPFHQIERALGAFFAEER